MQAIVHDLCKKQSIMVYCQYEVHLEFIIIPEISRKHEAPVCSSGHLVPACLARCSQFTLGLKSYRSLLCDLAHISEMEGISGPSIYIS